MSGASRRNLRYELRTMASIDRSRLKSTSLRKASLNQPDWYDSSSPLSSAVSYMGSLWSNVSWIGLYIVNKEVLELGPCLGKAVGRGPGLTYVATVNSSLRFAPQEIIAFGQGICGMAVLEKNDQKLSSDVQSELAVLIRNQKNKIFGVFHLTSPFGRAFGEEEEALVRRIARELGSLWPVR